MRKIILAALFYFLIGSIVSSETLRMAVYQLEPFLTLAGERDEMEGITLDYWREYIAPRMGVELEVVGPFPIKRIESMLENGEVDLISHLTKIPEREAVFLYPETHLTEIQICMAVLPDSPLASVSKPEDLYGKRISFIKSAYIPQFLLHDEIAFDLVSSEDYRRIQLDMLLAGRVDAALDLNYVSFLYYLDRYGYKDKVRVFLLPVEQVKVYSIFRNSEEGRRLMNAFDEVNRKGLEAGVYEQLVLEYMEASSIQP